jgi:hypothetical protein
MSSSSSFSPWVHEPPQGANAGGKRRNAGNGRGAGWAGGTQPTPACAPGTEGSARPTAGGWRRLWSRRAWEAAAAAPLRERPTAKRRRGGWTAAMAPAYGSGACRSPAAQWRRTGGGRTSCPTVFFESDSCKT